MGALTDLGLTTDDGSIMVISAPDSVLAEAGAMKPRPSFASTLLTAEPASRIVWWPEKRHLDGGTLRRLAWMVGPGSGVAWLVIDPAEEESPGGDELRSALVAVGMAVAEERAIGRGEVALRVTTAE
ncbi:MAG: hypothetical protein IH609_10905 [Dehalococcoidia bacterium]|nr:hypothetical protein [Dehalococcoidia bacterium]